MADILALYDASPIRDDLRVHLRPGEARVVGIVATREAQAMEHISNLSTLIHGSPLLSPLLSRENRNEIVLANGSIIRVYPCSARAIRGGAWSSAILDEFGHFEDTEGSNQAGQEVLQAVTPSLLQFGESGWLIVISTPRWRETAFGRLVEQASSRRFPDQLYVHKTTAEMRPDLALFLDKEKRRNPDMYVQEYEAQFLNASGAYLNGSEVVACVRTGVGILEPQPDVRYVGALDPAFTVDRFAMAVGHKDVHDNRVITDGIWSWHKQGYEVTLNGVAAVAEHYGITELLTDQFCAEPIREGLDRRRIYANYKPWTTESKSSAFARLKLAVNARRVEFPDDPATIDELCSLEARPTPAGFVRIAARTGHDDRAIAVAAVVNALDKRDEVVAIFAGSDVDWQKVTKEPVLFPAVNTLDNDGDLAWPKQW